MTKKLRLLSWNINSLRLRLPQLALITAEEEPDVICLQETKVQDADFPSEALNAMGYTHQLFKGMKSYNGVAILARHPLRRLGHYPLWCGRDDCRHLAASLTLGGQALTVHNFYVPAGGDEPDEGANDKFAHKMAFLREAQAWFAANPERGALLVGDLNVAPGPDDVWSHRQLLKVVSHTPAETEALEAWCATTFSDAMRHHHPAPARLYTWWSYRNRNRLASDRGRRLDHGWATPDLLERVVGARVLESVRDWERPSDHVPLLLDLAWPG
ncbi:exodeoxyribonuclease III [Formicincola oecophyllae]|uniref:Exodeoxyribonuclease III n=1 Tax=Formicincola oecophyllae TaxID=2558361 RepID=A0A4Y6UBN8_9PROT|nr:exodeoxyribonuclease III [Formicincola oecophyllae]QDH13978.1 exodeoxyribonuclease III [Formicincola oecophyllae]